MHKLSTTLMFAGALGATLFAQGPPPGAHGRGGFGPGFGPEGIMAAGPGSHTPVTGAPYAATQVTTFQQTLAGGNQITRTETSKVYRDSQGRVRMEHTAPANSPRAGQTTVTIFDPVAGASYLLNPAGQTAIKMNAPHIPADAPQGGRPHRGPAQANVQTEDLGKQVINGVTASGTRITETIPAGSDLGNTQPIQVVRETWISADLRVPVQIKSSDPRFGVHSMQLTNIVMSEPDAALFQVPAGFTVKSRGQGFGAQGRARRGEKAQVK